VLKSDVAKMTKVRGDINVIHEHYQPVEKHKRFESTCLNFVGDVAEIKVGDSKAGWVQALDYLIKLHYAHEYKYIKNIIINYNSVRPAGERLKTFGGRASGPEPLSRLIHFTTEVFKNSVGRKLNSLECHDILCYIADAVLAGGIRRSAALSLFSLDDEDMLTCKFGNWWEENPQRARANNSVMLIRHKVKKEDFYYVWERVKASGAGEPGIIFSNDKDGIYNPCQPKWATVLTKKGLTQFSEIEEGDDKTSLILKSLIITSIKDLNLHNDIRDLIVYVNNLKNLAFKNNIDFNQLLLKVIGISSDETGVYSISMKSFFQNVLNNKPIPISLNN
jgi:hypothetical protein